MIVAHITFDMAHAVVGAVAEMIRADALKAGVTLPLGVDELQEVYFRALNSPSPTTRLWIETLGEFGYHLRLDKTGLFSRPV